MQGKFVCSQSASTFLFLNRFSMVIETSGALVSFQLVGSGAPSATTPLDPGHMSLLGQGEIGLSAASDCNGLGLVLCPFVPDDKRVASIRDVFNLVVAALVGLRGIRSRGDHKVSRHFGVHVTEQRHDAWLVEGERSLLALGPGAEIV